MAFWIMTALAMFGVLAYKRSSLEIWTLAWGVFFLIFTAIMPMSLPALFLVWTLFLLLGISLNFTPIRRQVFSRQILNVYRKLLPALSTTEQEALAAGTVGWDGELFSGMPDWNKLHAYPVPQLSEEEAAFMNGPVSELCAMIDNWDITHNRYNLPPHMWEFLKQNGFFAIIIPKHYGGKGFSAHAHSAILTMIAGRSMSVGTVVAVPNSLGPAELLLHYGTQDQQEHYLPRLAQGIEIPCFALTGPEAGSDASAMTDYGIVCKGDYQGKEVIGIRLSWNKRYITLAPVATVLGLAFKLYDPDHLLGNKASLGITCALIPTNTPGVIIGRRHYPLNCAFPNGPTQGKEVFIPIDWIIGGSKMAGQGWRMLMECLAAGRAISLPSMVCGGSKIAAYASGAYARIRNQFHLPIGKFGGVEEALARMAGYLFIMDATRVFTISAIDRGEKPAVAAAISKYHVTELARKVVNDAMDIHGGKGICMGPRNYIANNYQETPIAITVEGANILTRSMIIFGQGVIRCHPYIITEMMAARHEDAKEGLKIFDRAIFSHMGYTLSNAIRSFVIGLTNAKWVAAPDRPFKRYYQHITRFSTALALMSDIAMMSLGGSLKRREKLSGRLGDVLSMVYLNSAILKRFEDEGRPSAALPVVKWASQYLLYQAQQSLDGVLVNFPIRWLGWILRFWLFPLGKRFKVPTDALGKEVASLMIAPDSLRDILAQGSYLAAGAHNPVGQMHEVLEKIIQTEGLENILQQAVRDKKVAGYTYEQRVHAAVQQELLTESQGQALLDTYQARLEILAVDDFQGSEIEDRFSAAPNHQPKTSRKPHEEEAIDS